MTHAVFTNNARTTLSGSLTNVATSASVVDGSVFPAPTGGDYAYLTIEEGSTVEIVKLTARSTNTLTITRAQDGTTGQAFTTAATVSLRLPRIVLDEFQTAIDSKLNSSAASAYGLTLIDDADAATARTTLGLVIGTNVQAQDAELAAIAGLTSAADSLPYFTGSGTAALATFTTAGRNLIDDADAAAQRTTLGLAIGTNVQAYDAGLQSIAGLTTAADRGIYTTASDTYAVYTLTAAGRALIDDADAAAQRTTLGVAIGTNVQAYDAGLQSIAALTTAADRGIYTTASDTYAVYTLTAAGRAILDDADAAAQRTTLGLGTAATVNTGTSGATIPRNDTANTFSQTQTLSGDGERLTITGAINPYIRIRDTTNTTDLFLQAADTVVNVGSASNHDVWLYSNNLQRGRITAAGDFELANATTSSDAKVRTRRAGNNIEWGHTTAAYHNALAAEAGSGAGFLTFGAFAGTTSNTYRTTGLLGAGVRSNNAGGMVFFTLTNSNADNQSPTDRMTLLASGELTITDVGPTSTLAAGYRGAPRNRQDSSYTLVLADAGKSIVGYGSTASQTWTIPANGSVAYPIGTTITFVNMRTVACSIACTTDTMYLAGTGATGTRTLASYGWATAVKVDTTNWMIGGTGLT
jgi:hypothetical protein